MTLTLGLFDLLYSCKKTGSLIIKQESMSVSTLNSRTLNLFSLFGQGLAAQCTKMGITPEATIEVRGVTSDSREVKPGLVFVATEGAKDDGHRFIAQAFEAGAAVVVGQRPFAGAKGLYFQVKDSRAALARIACEFYGQPSHQMLMVGVTGTSGKTTSTYLIESIFKAAGKKPGLIGTVNFRFGDKIYPSTHTTPGPVELQALLAEMLHDGCDAVVMEVSSHALKQSRIGSIAFDGMVFTNLSREHLDFHPGMDDYFDSKALLFTEYAEVAKTAGKKPALAVNLDSEYGPKLVKHASGAVGFSLSQAPGLQFGLNGIRGKMFGIPIESGLVGAFNASNVLGAVAVAKGLGIPDSAISRGVKALEYVPGRLEMVRAAESSGVRVMVDYAHKPDALEKVLETLRALVPRGKGRIVTVFGCGGDRDRTKRPVMGEIAQRLSDRVIVTSDNPRTEDPAKIINEITAGIPSLSYVVEPDRRKAIERAIEEAVSGDLILIAGKGHEDYQILGTTKIHFDDREIASEALTRVFRTL